MRALAGHRTVIVEADLRRLFIRQIEVIGSTLGNLAEFRDLLSVCARGRVKPLIERTYPLHEVPAALSRMERGEQFGKLAIGIGD